jgi:hypothetical protein
LAAGFFTSCANLDLNPLAEGSSETWYSTQEEIDMSVNDLYKDSFFPASNGDNSGADSWTDDWIYRETLTPVTAGTINGEWSFLVTNIWLNTYKAIGRANTLLDNLNRSANKIPAQTLIRYEAEVKFMRACFYSRLIFFFGDVIFYTAPLSLDEAFKMSRTSKNEVLKSIYEDFDFAAQNLPESYTGSAVKKVSKGAAYGMKARIALYMSDFQTAKNAAKACMDLNVYKLHSDFSNLFLTTTQQSQETIFGMPRSIEYKITLGIQNMVPRNSGGWAAMNPSWDLFCSFLCTDGLPIDESPLFDPHEPFKNRDPRCSATIVEFGKPHLGIDYQPHPDSLQVMNYNTGRRIANNDTRAVAQYASYNGLVWKKGVDETWLLNGWNVAPEKIILRYADVLLMYAEAKIELNEIDESVLDAINRVRARAYKADIAATTKYPAVTTTNQTKLRQIVRIERRMELAWENLRYMDIIRWKLAEKVLNLPNYSMLDPVDLRDKVVKTGGWFFPETPPIDEDGVADFSGMYNKGLVKITVQRQFNKDRQYLWPIPTKDILINDNLKQNPGY